MVRLIVIDRQILEEVRKLKEAEVEVLLELQIGVAHQAQEQLHRADRQVQFLQEVTEEVPVEGVVWHRKGNQ